MANTIRFSCVTKQGKNTNRKKVAECRWRHRIPEHRRWEAIPTLVVNGSRGRKWALSGNRFGDKAPASTGGGGSTNGGDRLGPSPRVGGDEVQLSGEHCGEPAGDVCCS